MLSRKRCVFLKIWTLERQSKKLRFGIAAANLLNGGVFYKVSTSEFWKTKHLSRHGLFFDVFFNDVFENEAFHLKALIYSALELAGGAAAAGVFTVTHQALWLIPVQVHPT